MATPLDADAACTRRWGNGTGRSSACIPHSVAKGKQEVLGARDTAVAPLSQPRRGCVTCARAYCTRNRPLRSTGAHHGPHHTIRQKTRESQKASLPQSPGALGQRPKQAGGEVLVPASHAA